MTGLWFDGQKYDRANLQGTEEERELPVFQQTKIWLDVYFSGNNPGKRPALKLEGSAFRQTVAEIMQTIPFGQTMTYGGIAREIARRTGKEHVSAQAVGGAVGHNPISILVPCHRVVGTNGSLTGYAGGIERKIWLLENEHVDLAANGLYVPR